MPSTERSPRRIADTLLILGFLAAIAAPAVDEWLRPSNVRSVQAERRRANPKPQVRWDPLAERPWGTLADSLRAYPDKYDAWYGDAFGLRDKLIQAHNSAKWFALGVSPTPTLVLGPQNWIFFTWHRSTDTHRGVFPFGRKELEAWRELLELRRDWLAERGIEFLFAIAPNKSAVYPEYFPGRFDKIGDSRREQFFAYMAKHSDVELLDLLDVIRDEKVHDSDRPDDTSYYRLGTHWTDRGIYAGYCEILRRLQPALPGLEAWPRSDFELREREGAGDSWASRLYMEAQLPQIDWAFAPARELPTKEVPYPAVGDGWRRFRWVHEDETLPNLLLVHDSFGTPLLPYLAPHFGRAVGYRRKDFDAALVDAEKPDVVVMIYTERVLVSAKSQQLLNAARRGLTDKVRTVNVTGVAKASAGPRAIAKRFEGAPEHLYELDVFAEHGVEAFGDSSVLRVDDLRALTIETKNGASGFRLPQMPASAGVLHLRVTSPRRETLRIFYTTAEQEQYGNDRVLTVPLEEAVNDVYVALDELGIEGHMLVRPGRRLGRFLLHAAEIRAAKP